MLLFFALLSTTLQLSVLLVSGFTVYNQALFTRIGGPSRTYGFPLFLTGTILLVVGMLVCSYTIEQSTIERSWSRIGNDGSGLGIIWLQRKQSVNDQSFDPFLIVGHKNNDQVITSTRADPNSGDTNSDDATFAAHMLALSGAVLGLVGFFLQFQGLRGLSWPSSVAQLVAIILMAVIRASVRYSLSRRPQQYAATETFEMEWLSLRLVLCRNDQFPTPFLSNNGVNDDEISHHNFLPKDSLFWTIVTADNGSSQKTCYASPGIMSREMVAPNQKLPENKESEPSDHELILKVRRRLGSLASWEGPASKDALSLCKAIESVMNQFFRPEPNKNWKTFKWSLKAQIGDDTMKPSDWPEGKVSFAVEYNENGWKADSSVFDAALSLWMSHMQRKSTPSQLDWLRQRAGTEVQYWRVIGDNSNKILERDLRWWVNDILAEEIVKSDATFSNRHNFGSMLVIGFQGFRYDNDVMDGNFDSINPQASPINSSSQKTLAIQRSGALPNVLAQHVFSAFIWSVAAEIPHTKIGSGRILQSEKFSEANISDSWTSPSLQTQELTLYAQAVERTGLCSFDEAYISIIPPLSHLHKLPNEVIVNLARERVAERRLDLYETSKTYLDILQHSIINQPCRYFGSIVAAVIEFLFLVSEPLIDKSDLGMICKEAAELRDVLKMALKHLGINQKTFIEELQFLYEKQSRDLAFKRVLGEEIYTNSLSKSNYYIPAEHKSAWWGLSDDHLNAINSECSTGLKSSERDIFGWTPLHYAVTTGKRNQVYASKSLPILADMVGRNPVHHAARCGDHEILVVLLGTRIDKKKDAANKVESKGMLPLHLAAQSENAVEVAKLLLPYTDDINLRDRWGRTALYLAAEKGSRGIVGVLVGEDGDDPKAEINIECDHKLQRRTALHAAVACRHHSILAILAGKDGRGLKWKDLNQKTALELAVENDCELSLAALVKVFESTHVSALEAHAPKRETALPSAWLEVPGPERARRRKSTLIEPGNASRFLQQSEREARHQSKEDNETVEICHWEEALDMSVNGGRRKALVKMIEVSKGTSREKTWALALRTAAKEGKEDILALILGHQVRSKNTSQKFTGKLKDANPPRRTTATAQDAIDSESQVGRQESRSKYGSGVDATEGGWGMRLERMIVSLAQTIDMKILVNKTDAELQTPLFLAASNGHAKAVDILLGKEADMEISKLENFTPLYSAAASGHVEVVKTLLAQGANKNATLSKPWTPLHAAARYNHVAIVKILLEDGAIIEASDAYELTPLNTAAGNGHLIVVQMLLGQSANIETKDKDGLSPLNSAAEKGHAKVVEALLHKGAKTEAADEDGLTPLNSAAKKGHLAVVKMLLEKKANIETADKEGWTPLNSAARKGHTKVAEALLQEGANIEATSKNGYTPLMAAANIGHPELVKVLKGANREAINKDGWTPLRLAVNGGNVEVVKAILETGAGAEATAYDGFTPLMAAVHIGHAEIVKLLLENGANTEAAGKDGSTPLNWAARSGDLIVVKMLLDKGAKMEVTDENGSTPLSSATKNGHFAEVEVLLEKGASKEAADKEGRRPLHAAVYSGHFELFEVLLEKGAEMEAVDKRGCTPLHLAASKGYVEIVNVLMEKGANKEVPAENGWTPLHSAANGGQAEVAKALLDKGANTEAVDKDESTPLNLSSAKGHFTIAKMLIEKGANKEAVDNKGWRPLHSAVNSGNLELFEVLLEKGASKEAVNKQGWSPLHLAARRGCVEIVNALIRKGANIEISTEDGWTPLHLAAKGGQAEVAKALLDKGANTEATYQDGSTPLSLAAKNGCFRAVEMLLETKANKEAVDKEGWTPLNSASHKGYTQIVKLLLKKQANKEAANSRGWTPLNSAAKTGHASVVKTLLESGANMEAADDDGCTPLTSAARKGHARVVEILTRNRNYNEAENEHGQSQLTKFWEGQDDTDEEARHRYRRERAYSDSTKEEADLGSRPVRGRDGGHRVQFSLAEPGLSIPRAQSPLIMVTADD